MKTFKRFLRRLHGLFRGRRPDAELAEELEFHIELQTEDNIRSGMSFEEARRAARLKFGGIEAVKEGYRDQRGLPFIESVIADIRYAVRQLRRTPGFTLTVVITIALGIGANTAIFSMINALVLKPLPISEPDRVVFLTTRYASDPGDGHGDPSASPAFFVHWRAQSSVIEHVSALTATGMNYTGGGAPELWHALKMSADLFHTLRMPILMGRGFSPEEDIPNGPKVAVISRGLWQRRFAGDSQVIGKTVALSGEPYSIVGVVSDSSGFLEAVTESRTIDVYVPFQIHPESRETSQTFFVLARLKQDVPIDQARERLSASSADLRSRLPNALGPEDSFSAMTLGEGFQPDEERPAMYLMMIAVLAVLLIACANVANLLLVRASTRGKEIGIRIAVGAGRRRVIRQLLTESLIFSFLGSSLGLVFGHLGIHALINATLTEIPTLWKVDIDWRVLTFAFALSLVTAVFFGLFPALQASRLDLNSILKDSGGRWGTGLGQNKLRGALVISEVSLAVILLAGSALLIRSSIALYTVDRGFETENVLLMHTSMNDPKHMSANSVANTIRDGLNRVRAIPGVVAASATGGYAPLKGNLGGSFTIAGQAPSDGSSTGNAGWTPVTSEYFDVFKIALKRGRMFTGRDDAKSAPVAIINEAMAAQFWKGADPLKDRIVLQWDGSNGAARPRQIVGIVADVRQIGLRNTPEPRMYVPHEQLTDNANAFLVRLAPTTWVVRTRVETHKMTADIQQQLQQATELPVYDPHSMDEIVSLSIQDDRGLMVVITVVASLALLLAVVGIYGVMTYSVQQRTQEIGIRLALGARAGQVRNMVVRQGLMLTLAGVAIGIASAWQLAHLMQSMLFGVEARDPIVFMTVPIVLGAVALLAVWQPANRASRIQPIDALRHE